MDPIEKSILQRQMEFASTLRLHDIEYFKDIVYTIVGCGGIGSWLAISLVMAGIKNLVLFDDDTLALSNLNRLPYRIADVGRPKVDVLEDFLRNMREDLNIYKINSKFNVLFFDNLNGFPFLKEENIFKQILLDCTDNFEAQLETAKFSKDYGIERLRVGTLGNHFTVTDISPDTITSWETLDGAKTEEEIEKEEGNERGRCGVHYPQWIPTQLLAAGMTLYKLLTRSKDRTTNRNFTLGFDGQELCHKDTQYFEIPVKNDIINEKNTHRDKKIMSFKL